MTVQLTTVISIVLGIAGPLFTIIAYFVKRMIGKVEADIDKCCEVNENLDNRLTDLEKTIIQVGTYHRMNHPGQEIHNV